MANLRRINDFLDYASELSHDADVTNQVLDGLPEAMNSLVDMVRESLDSDEAETVADVLVSHLPR